MNSKHTKNKGNTKNTKTTQIVIQNGFKTQTTIGNTKYTKNTKISRQTYFTYTAPARYVNPFYF